jgi:hypothetical protein
VVEDRGRGVITAVAPDARLTLAARPATLADLDRVPALYLSGCPWCLLVGARIERVYPTKVEPLDMPTARLLR